MFFTKVAPANDDNSVPDGVKHRIPKDEYEGIKNNLCRVIILLRMHSYMNFLPYKCKFITHCLLIPKLYCIIGCL